MKMLVGTKWKEFTVGHRIPWHEKCGRMHGHNLRVRVEVEGEIDAATGMVVDFGVLGTALAALTEPLDHMFMAAQTAVLKEFAGTAVKDGKYYVIDEEYILPERDVVVMPMDIVSTENLAWYFLTKLTVEPWAMGKTVRVQVSENGENIAEVSWGHVNWYSTATMNLPAPVYFPDVIVPFFNAPFSTNTIDYMG